jgi:uncharacterized protein
MQVKKLYCNDHLLTENLQICTGFWERARGLIARVPLQVHANEGLLIPKCGSVHTLFMAYSIDVIFLSSAGQVLSIRRNLKPYGVAACFSAACVIEFNAGTAVVDKIQIGDCLSWRSEHDC